MYIIIEGICCAGKSNLISALVSHLNEINLTGVVIFEPTFGKFGKEIRKLSTDPLKRNLKQEHLLFTKDRKENVQNKIKPLLDFVSSNPGFILIQDRGYLSAPAYQAENETEMEKIIKEQRKITPAPDYFFLLDVPVDLAVSRAEVRSRPISLFENVEVQKIARKRYLTLAKNLERKVIVLDGKKGANILCKEVIQILGLA